ncbi:MAG: di-trans,poly-cis-decaprenylcistransferase [Candidatus Komeilibacteria bacterium CG11_big_fil_rev_8_21_14_0_20_36_20]|uniref:Isoprenyl transferase n=1 Tax=Candidatus Komeilibacteria bacterium CG11_big_fil_rev_8_21_14_0_20_36_20 TaxID=1974477 RepID=A0A2H0NDM4_9BACT|nr:MAG: di-trans,poly-cis-decaprenylcistransferase [Candidatus Komeilibacteria bacterium CG11_big_fil_rev_8_21_14_0_20_36_20]PIR81697.1 MAG: di-trans,poly-cis-decaprenylcistransferase [Candidatus Komeilibacteria bacterium CG10_big_fil_rev_8_21_14_0_10_36_65]PJC54896.1 MAG: di-trans,poly-cis-decaprenylcistransferase [Candidatus Komeilibacteria bacterium CG_4_9_14_0_2_um_filter_36_13]
MNKNIPQHIGIIIDGNRRWAKARGLTTLQGHKKGRDRIKEIAQYAFDKGIKILTIYTFSTENWKRSEREINNLLKLFRFAIIKDLDIFLKNDIRLKIIGKVEELDKGLQKDIKAAEAKTKNNKRGLVQICFNYGGRLEITEAIRKIIKNKIKPNQITPQLIGKYLWTANVADPDLIIRTSGEQRLSGFLTWQSVYSEFFFLKKHWPDFTEKDLDKIISAYCRRKRRFGGN